MSCFFFKTGCTNFDEIIEINNTKQCDKLQVKQYNSVRVLTKITFNVLKVLNRLLNTFRISSQQIHN